MKFFIKWAACVALILVTAIGAWKWYQLSQKDKVSAQKCTTPVPYHPTLQSASTARHDLLVSEASKSSPRVLFLGDSLTDRWRGEGSKAWNAILKTNEGFNAGIDNDRTENVLFRIKNGSLNFASPPEICILLIGINNLGGDRDTPYGTSRGVEEIAKELRRRLPETKVVIVGLLPSGEFSRGTLSRRARTNRILSKLNIPGTTFVDFSEQFLNDRGGIKTQLSTDNLHLSEKGYELLAKCLSPHL